MKPTLTRGATHNFQPPENWVPEKDGECGDLQVRAEHHGQRKLIQLVSTWRPSPEELARLNAGCVIEVLLITVNQPPMAVTVVDPVVSPVPKSEVPHVTINEDAHGF